MPAGRNILSGYARISHIIHVFYIHTSIIFKSNEVRLNITWDINLRDPKIILISYIKNIGGIG